MEANMVDKLVTLGVLINNKGEDEASIDHRIAKADKTFWKNSRTFRGKGIVANKIATLAQTPGAVALHGAGVWDLGVDHLRKLRTWENETLRRIFERKRGSTLQEYRGESTDFFNIVRRGMGQGGQHIIEIRQMSVERYNNN